MVSRFLLLAFLSLFIVPLSFANEYRASQSVYETGWYSSVDSACKAWTYSSNPDYSCGQFSDWDRCATCSGSKNNISIVSRASQCTGFDESGLCLEICEDGLPKNIPSLDINTCDRLPVAECPDGSFVQATSISAGVSCDLVDTMQPPDYSCLDAISCLNEALTENSSCIDYTFDYTSPDDAEFICLLESQDYVEDPNDPDQPTLEELVADVGMDFENPFEEYNPETTTPSAGDIAGAVQDSLESDFSKIEYSINSQTDHLTDGLSDIDNELEHTNDLLTTNNELLAQIASGSGSGDNTEPSDILGDQNNTSGYMDRIKNSNLLKSAVVSFSEYEAECEPYNFTFSSDVSGTDFTIDETIDAHCTMLPEYSGILSAICLFAASLFSIRIVLSA